MTSWKTILAPVLVFVLGAVCGGAVTAFYAIREVRQIVQPTERNDPAPVAVRVLSRRLQLDPEQRAAAEPVFAELARRLAEIRGESRPRADAAIKESAERLRPLLREEQQERLDHLLERWERLDRARHRRRSGGLPPPAVEPAIP